MGVRVESSMVVPPCVGSARGVMRLDAYGRGGRGEGEGGGANLGRDVSSRGGGRDRMTGGGSRRRDHHRFVHRTSLSISPRVLSGYAVRIRWTDPRFLGCRYGPVGGGSEARDQKRERNVFAVTWHKMQPPTKAPWALHGADRSHRVGDRGELGERKPDMRPEHRHTGRPVTALIQTPPAMPQAPQFTSHTHFQVYYIT